MYNNYKLNLLGVFFQSDVVHWYRNLIAVLVSAKVWLVIGMHILPFRLCGVVSLSLASLNTSANTGD